jgi:mannose-6-phosphate isomerase-like protein (cupin superfamily)
VKATAVGLAYPPSLTPPRAVVRMGPVPVVEGFVIAEQDVDGVRAPGDTAEVRTTIDASRGCERLEQRVIRFDAGRSAERGADGRQEVLFVVSGHGVLHLAGGGHPLEPAMGVFIAPGESYLVEAPEELLVVSVSAPASENGVGERRRVTVRYDDQPVLPASPNREFRYLVNQDAGCLDVTQFVGIIPPGRAPEHSHTYDEVVYILEGKGVYHVAGEDFALAPGTCLHLPPYVRHCIENTESIDMKVLGVFHPSGDPASRAFEGGTNDKEGK